MQTNSRRKMLVSMIALSLIMSGFLTAGSSRGYAASSSTGSIHSDTQGQTPADQRQQLSRWRKQAEKMRKGFFPVLDEASKLFGIERSALEQQLAAGNTLAQLAAGQGIAEDDLIRQLGAGRTAKLEEAVQAGQLSRSRADEIEAKLTSHIGYMVRLQGLQEAR